MKTKLNVSDEKIAEIFTNQIDIGVFIYTSMKF